MSSGKDIAIKVCGMRDPENILQVASLGPQYLGFIFYPDSPRYVGKDFELPQNLPSSFKKVGVFVNESTDVMLSLAEKVGFEFVQLHGIESVEQSRTLKASGLNVIKVFSVDDAFNFEVTRAYKNVVDYFLFDTKGKFYGGNARTFNWNILRKYDQEIPFFLSGGLSPENVGELGDIQSMNLHALDLNSGVELSPGLKSLEKIKAIIKQTTSQGP